jgi:hypothetical protein
MEREARGAGDPASISIADDARTLYDELVRARDRIASLPPVSQAEIETVLLAQHEVFWFLMTPPTGAPTDLPLSESTKQKLAAAARDRDADLHTMVVALVAMKLAAWQRRGPSDVIQLQDIECLLDALTFDYRRPKRTTLSILRGLKHDIDARIAYVIRFKQDGYSFTEQPPLYRNRVDKKETPIAFFNRVYSGHARRGLTQADLRKIDPGFYNVLHVFCVRHKRMMSSLLPSTRPKQTR